MSEYAGLQDEDKFANGKISGMHEFTDLKSERMVLACSVRIDGRVELYLLLKACLNPDLQFWDQGIPSENIVAQDPRYAGLVNELAASLGCDHSNVVDTLEATYGI